VVEDIVDEVAVPSITVTVCQFIAILF